MVSKSILLSAELGSNAVAPAVMDTIGNSNSIGQIVVALVLRLAFFAVEKLIERQKNKKNQNL